jgi:RNA polymerase sigma-70 factor, ECF subfamily
MQPSKPAEATRSADLALIARIRQGEAGAFEELYRLQAPRLYSLACRLTGSPTEGEDLLQEIFVLAYRKLDGFKGESSVATWLYRLATNCCLDFLRSRQGRMRLVGEPFEETMHASLDRGLGRVDRLDLDRAIAALPPGYRAAFVLHDVEGFGHQEVGAMLGIAEGTSKSQVHKARMKIREHLALRRE